MLPFQVFRAPPLPQVLAKVPWYGDRTLSNVSLGSVMVMVLVRAIQTNIAHVRVRGGGGFLVYIYSTMFPYI